MAIAGLLHGALSLPCDAPAFYQAAFHIPIAAIEKNIISSMPFDAAKIACVQCSGQGLREFQENNLHLILSGYRQ